MRKWMLVGLCLFIGLGLELLAGPGNAEAASKTAAGGKANVYMNGFQLTEWRWERNTIMVPLFAFDDYSYFGNSNDREITYKWDAATKTVWVYSKGKTNAVKLIADKPVAWVNGKEVELAAPVKIIDGHTYVPLRFVSEALGGEVEWNNSKRTAIIRTPERVRRDGVLRTGGLEDARKEALLLPFVFPNRELPYHAEGFEVKIEFPEGEALRYYYTVKDVKSYVAVNADGLAEVLWQGRTTANPDIYVEQSGTRPEGEEALIYFEHTFPIQDTVKYGKIGKDGKAAELGSFEVRRALRASADAVTSIAGEKRKDAAATPGSDKNASQTATKSESMDAGKKGSKSLSK
ncbi:copper amine oxidase N-terminal domain-containing protein [Paenibacillus popilliae]|uniref:Periplasmic component n=1 Tax=Paenibacillus popilliae ATCC 14706 TaxID=1212764 RepID=M9M7R5_PAEPP|nr:copper amine oxidase N-terminal domain-containing protein [Paenibacillus popilliae]GAC43833.1 periplasmic component [Paenibacillus popilliae ATCC 14706]